MGSRLKAYPHKHFQTLNIHILGLASSSSLLRLCSARFITLVFHLSFIILPFSLPVCLTVGLCAVLNMLRGHMSTPNTTEQICYFVSVHSSFGPIHVLAFCCCHAWWGFLHCPTRGRNTFQGMSAEAHIHTWSCNISFRLTFLCSAQNTVWKQPQWNSVCA